MTTFVLSFAVFLMGGVALVLKLQQISELVEKAEREKYEKERVKLEKEKARIEAEKRRVEDEFLGNNFQKEFLRW